MELEFRNVTLRDRDEILGALSEDVYAGHDYLPCFFDGWMQDGEHQMICAVDKATGIIMALDTVSLFDQGRTIMFQALRVHRASRGMGVGSRMSKHMQELVAQHYPSAERIRVCTQDCYPQPINIHLKLGYKPVTRHGFAMGVITKPCHQIPMSQLSVPGTEDLHVIRVSAVELWACLELMTDDERATLIDGNVLLIDWMTYEPSRSNLIHMEQAKGIGFAVLSSQAPNTAEFKPHKLLGFYAYARPQRLSGVHLYVTPYTMANPIHFGMLALHGIRTLSHGAAFVCLSYEIVLRDARTAVHDSDPPSVSLATLQQLVVADTHIELMQNTVKSATDGSLLREFSVPPVVQALQNALDDAVDFSADYVGGGKIVLEKSLHS
eukprot:m.146858 g.146858  ORF g.146858 m.146858 type:complete len:380 (-) comp14154_c0_seq2:127-1266(-)